MTSNRWQDWMVLLLGAWLFVSAFVLDHAQTATATNAFVAGLAIVLFTTLAIIEPRMWEEWVTLGLGAWLIVSPFALGAAAGDKVTWNAIVVGVMVGAAALHAIFRAIDPRPSAPRSSRRHDTAT